MKDDFDKIIQRLLSEMPQHTPKSDAWVNINKKLDEDLSLNRMREILKNTEHAPKQELWSNIENALDKSLKRSPFYTSRFFRISLSSFIVVCTTVLLYLFNNPFSNNSKFAQTDHRRLKCNDIITGIEPINNDNINNIVDSVTLSSASDQSVYTTGNNAENNVKKNGQNFSNSASDKSKEILSGNNSSRTNVIVGLEERNLQTENLNDNVNTSDNKISEKQNEEFILKRIQSVICSSVPYYFEHKLSSDSMIIPGAINLGNLSQGMGEGNVSLELSVAPEAAFSSLYNNTQSDYNLYMDIRRNAEYPGLSYTAGIEAKIDYRHWYFQSGIDLSKTVTCAKYKFQSTKFDTLGWVLFDTMFVQQTIDSSNGYADTIPAHFIYTWNPITGTINSVESKKAIAEIQYIQIPLLAGYSVSTKNFIYSFATGVSCGIPISVNGDILSTNNSGLTEMTQLKSQMRKPLFSLIIRAGASYVLNSRYSISLQPAFRYNLNSVFDRTYPVGTKQAVYGLRFGLIYRF